LSVVRVALEAIVSVTAARWRAPPLTNCNCSLSVALATQSYKWIPVIDRLWRHVTWDTRSAPWDGSRCFNCGLFSK